MNAIPEIVIDGETGVLVPPGDVPALAAAMDALAASPERRAAMGAAARARIEARNSVAAYGRALGGILREVARG